MGVRIIEVVYSKTFSMVYDIMGLGRLIHNDDDFLELLTQNSTDYYNDIAYYKSLINMVETPNKNVASMFYQYNDTSVVKVIFSDIQNLDTISKIQYVKDFYKILSNPDYILSVVNQVYFPKYIINSDELPTKSELYGNFLVMPLSQDIEDSLYLFFENPYNFGKMFISELKKYSMVIEKLYTINRSEITKFRSTFLKNKIDIYNKHFNGTLNNYQTIKIGITYTNVDIIYYNRWIKDTMILFLGKNSDKLFSKDSLPEAGVIEAATLRKIISDKTRLKILKLLKNKDMHGNEIAEKVSVKRNLVKHHIDLMTRENVLSFYIKDNNIYYKINSEYFQRIYNFIKDFI